MPKIKNVNRGGTIYYTNREDEVVSKSLVYKRYKRMRIYSGILVY